LVASWESLDALKAFTGEAWKNPVLDPAAADLVLENFLDQYSLIEGE
jgi:hypothetical protein